MLALDIARFIVAAAGGLLAAHQLQLAFANAGAGWRGHTGVAVLLLIVAGSRIEKVGHPVTWQFFATAAAVALVGWSSVRRRARRSDHRATT